MGKIILVIGGARSGKSSFAEGYVKEHGKKLAYIATAQVLDEEMRQRVALHQKRRIDDNWHTEEAPFAAEKAIAHCKSYDAVLFDCLTIYMSNLLCQKNMQKCTSEECEIKIRNAVQKLIEAAREHKGFVVFVTNEVGASIVPENKLARLYRDIAGFCNQDVAKVADVVYFVVAGIKMQIK